MNWLWAYLRRKTMESILAGVHDALTAGGGPTGLTEEQAARAALAIASGAAPATQTADLPGDPIPQLTSATEPTTTTEVRRGPGRPRKYQEPPQE
jgi:hypothetical protein